MSGFTASPPPETGRPPLASSKWSPSTSRATKTPWVPLPTSSLHAIHGTVVPPGVSVPAATRGSSASWPGTAFSEQRSSWACDSAHGPKPWTAPLVSSAFVCPPVPRPTAT